jgi:hypothetical protein
MGQKKDRRISARATSRCGNPAVFGFDLSLALRPTRPAAGLTNAVEAGNSPVVPLLPNADTATSIR